MLCVLGKKEEVHLRACLQDPGAAKTVPSLYLLSPSNSSALVRKEGGREGRGFGSREYEKQKYKVPMN